MNELRSDQYLLKVSSKYLSSFYLPIMTRHRDEHSNLSNEIERGRGDGSEVYRSD